MTDNNTLPGSSPQAVGCPALTELAAHLVNADPEIALHLEMCRRCRALLPSLCDVAAARHEVLASRPRAAVPARRTAPVGDLQLGELVTVRGERVKGMLLVALVVAATEDRRLARVAPVTTDLGYLGDNDLRLAAADTPLMYEAAAQLWNLGWVATKAIVERFGLANESVVSQLRKLVASLDDVLAPVAREDARFLFQELERESAAQFFVPVPLMALAHRFQEAAATTSSLLCDLAANGWSTDALDDLRRDVIDPRRVAPEQVAKLFELAVWVTDVGAVDDEQVIDALRRSIGKANVGGAPQLHGYARFLHFAQHSRTPRLLDQDAFVNEVLRLLKRDP